MTDMTECGKMTKDVEARIEVSEIQYLKQKQKSIENPHLNILKKLFQKQISKNNKMLYLKF